MASPVPSGLADALASELFESTSVAVPVNLRAVARRLGVQRIALVQIVEDGRTYWDEGGPVIELRGDRPERRRRFTFAHELAHVLLAQGVTRPSIQRRTSSLSMSDEERLCDRIAAALLMPRWWIEPRVQRVVDLACLRQIGDGARVSLSAAAVRVGEVRRRRCSLIQWRRSPRDRWVVTSHAGLPRALIGTIRLSDHAQRRLSRERHDDCWTQIDVTVDGIAHEVECQLSRGAPDQLLMLVTSDFRTSTPRDAM
jgi:IrrE N-terminal-like domain